MAKQVLDIRAGKGMTTSQSNEFLRNANGGERLKRWSGNYDSTREHLNFKEIDISTPEGEKVADKYHVTWSSLFVNKWQNGKEVRNDMTRFGFENARTNTAAFKAGLKNKINQLLK